MKCARKRDGTLRRGFDCARGGILWLCTLWFCLALPRIAWGESADGFAEPYDQVRVAAAESGLLAELLVREGAEVVPGQLLGSLDCDVLLADRRLAETRSGSTARRDAAQAELALRKTRLAKLEKLQSMGDANADEVERARADARVAEANLAAMEEERALAALELAKLDALIERRKIRSPVAGVVVSVERKRGEFVTVTEPQVAVVVNTRQLIVRFHVPQSVASRLRVGASHPLDFGEPVGIVSGKIEFVSPLTDVESSTVRVHALIDNSAGTIHSGARCQLVATPDLSRLVEPRRTGASP